MMFSKSAVLWNCFILSKGANLRAGKCGFHCLIHYKKLTHKGEAGNAIVDRESKTASAIFSAFNAPCCGSFESRRYGSNVTPIGPSDAEKIADAVLFFVSTIAFRASLLNYLVSIVRLLPVFLLLHLPVQSRAEVLIKWDHKPAKILVCKILLLIIKAFYVQ